MAWRGVWCVFLFFTLCVAFTGFPRIHNSRFICLILLLVPVTMSTGQEREDAGARVTPTGCFVCGRKEQLGYPTEAEVKLRGGGQNAVRALHVAYVRLKTVTIRYYAATALAVR